MVPVLAWMPGTAEWIVILIVALLLFGRRLPEVGRSLGQGLVEFKKGLKGVTDDVEPIKRDVESVRRDVGETMVLDEPAPQPRPAPQRPAENQSAEQKPADPRPSEHKSA